MRVSVTMILTATMLVYSSLVPSAFCEPLKARATHGWRLPRQTGVEDDGPHTYRFTMAIVNADAQGEIVSRQRLTGDYTRGLPGGQVEWNNVAQADAAGASGEFAPPQKRDFMTAFRYVNRLADTMKPDFFSRFPPMAMAERNLVWDTGMIEYFGQGFFDRLALNVPFHVAGAEHVDMPGIGTFQNRDIVLEWVGRSRRNGRDCALINYQAFLNPVRVTLEGLDLHARSEYWGQIWVAIESRQIEHATLHETVVGQLQVSGQPQAQVVNVFRSGALERLGAGQ